MEIRSREEWGNCRYLRTQMDVEELGTVEITEVIQYIKEDIGEPYEVVVYSSIVVPEGKIDTEEEKEFWEEEIYKFLNKELPNRYQVRMFS
jgi:signal peptidase I